MRFAWVVKHTDSVPNYCQSVSPKQTTLEEDRELFKNFSSILCLWFDIQGRRTDNFFYWVLNTDTEVINLDLQGHTAISNPRNGISTLLLYTDLGRPRGITRRNVLLSIDAIDVSYIIISIFKVIFTLIKLMAIISNINVWLWQWLKIIYVLSTLVIESMMGQG